MKSVIITVLLAISALAQAPKPGTIVGNSGGGGGGGTGTVTSVVIAGTTNQITATGTCTITTTGTCTLSLPSGLVLPGTVNGLAITTTTGTITIASAKVLTVSNSLTLAGTDGVTLTFPTTNATIARTDAGQTFTGNQTMTALLQSGSTAPTQTQADNSTKVATTAYVDAGLAGAGTVSGLTANCIPKASGATAITGCATITDVTTALLPPSAPVVTVIGTPGTATCGYVAQAYNDQGHGLVSVETDLTTCPNILDSTNKMSIVVGSVAGASSIEIFRQQSSGSPTSTGPIGSLSGAGGTLIDNGIVTAFDFGFAFDVTPSGNTSTGMYTPDHITQGDLGDAEAAWFGTPKLSLAFNQGPYLTSGASKYVFMHSGSTNYLADTVYVGFVSDDFSGNALEAQQFTNNSNGGFGTGLWGSSANIGSSQSDQESGVVGKVNLYGSGGITDAFGIHAENAGVTGTGLITNQYGFHADDLSAGSTANYGFHSSLTAGSGKWAFYGAGTAASHFGGLVELTDGSVQGSAILATLPVTPVNGQSIYCTDCQITGPSDNTCVGAGSGAFASRINGAWKCQQ